MLLRCPGTNRGHLRDRSCYLIGKAACTVLRGAWACKPSLEAPCLLDRRDLLAGVDELDAVALIFEAEREVETLPALVFTLFLTRRQRCEGHVPHAAKAG